MLIANAQKQSLRLLKHELKQGELTIVFFAIVLAVAAVFSLTGFAEHIKTTLISQSSAFIAADRVLETSRPIDKSILEKSRELKLKVVEQVVMSSMVFSNDDNDPKMLLSSIIATTQLYPLRGKLLVSRTRSDHTGDNTVDNAESVKTPERGTVWVAPKVLSRLQININDAIDIGSKTFVVAGVIKQLPDASFSVFSMGPSIILNMDDLQATELVLPGSRIRYKTLFAGNNENIKLFAQWLIPQLNETQRFYGIKSRQNALAKTLNKAEKYLSLASMLGIILAAVAVAVGARQYSQRQQKNVAIFKALGASSSYIRQVYILHWTILTGLAMLAGLSIGYLLQYLGLWAISDVLENIEEGSLFIPFISAIVTGSVCAIAFAIVPFKQLFSISPLRVIHSALIPKPLHVFWQYLPAFIALLFLLMFFSQDISLSIILFSSGIFIAIILMLLAVAMLKLGRGIGTKAGKALQLAFANLTRYGKENSIQLVSFTIAIHLLLLLLVVRNELINEWQAQLPQHTANRFLINIAESELNSVNQFIKQNNIASSQLYPTVAGRLTAINKRELPKFTPASEQENKSASSEQQQGVGRELNLTWQQFLPKKNKLIAGQWWQSDDRTAQVSVEQGIAKRLNIQLGDTLAFQLGSQHFSVKVTSIRRVNWQSMQPNFFMIFNPEVLKNFPATYIASMYIDTQQTQPFELFLNKHPAISVINVDAMINQLRKVIKQVSLAIEFILLLVMLAGSLVLVAQVQATMAERKQTLAILRTLGAKGTLLRNSVLYEFVFLGAFAGLLASGAMEIAMYFIQTNVFNMQPSFHGRLWGVGIISGACFVGLLGLLSCRRLLTKKSLHRYVA